MIVAKRMEIDMGHRVPNHASKCKNPHGHRYRFEVAVNDKVRTEEGASDEGMVIDFGELKRIMTEEIDEKYDHGFMVYENDAFADDFVRYKQEHGMKVIVVPFIPTAENIAHRVFGDLHARLSEVGIQIEYVRVFETPNSFAVFSKDME